MPALPLYSGAVGHEILTRTPPTVGRRIAYGAGPSHFGDLRLPSGPGPHPLVIFLHGGWWRSLVGLEYAGNLCAPLEREGIASWNLEYRRTGESGGGWPMTFDDAATGADFVATLAETMPIDLKRVITMGHSAGGHLAMWLAARHRIPSGSRLHAVPRVAIRGVVSLAGAVDLRLASALGLGRSPEGTLAVHELMGGRPQDVPEHYQEGSPGDLLPLGVRQVIVTGTADETVPCELGRSYVQRARALGDDATLVEIAGADHFDPVDPDSGAYPRVREAVLELIGGPVR